MIIKTGNEIYLEGCDVREQSKKFNYDDRTTKERKVHEKTKWVEVDGIIRRLKNLKEINDYDKLYSNDFDNLIKELKKE